MSEVIEINYNPTNKAMQFHASSARVQVLVGGLGSGKSHAVIREIEQSCLQWAGMPIAVYRKTMPALRDSTLHEYKSHIAPGLGVYKEKLEQYQCHNGSFVNFRGLDDPRKAKSTEYACIIMEEADEFTLEDFKFLTARVRKKGPWPLRIILVLNPVDELHWIYKQFVENAAAYQSAGGLLELHFSTYDNIDNLPEGYIEQQTAGMTAEEIDRYINGNWGSISKGTPVYASLLNPALHLYKMPRHPGQSLIRGWDFGFNRPACSFRLVDNLGRMNIAHCLMGDKEELDIFARRVLIETTNIFPEIGFIKDYGDPRGHDKSQNSLSTGAGTSFKILEDMGIYATGERGAREYVEPGIKQVRTEFCKLINGIPQLTIDPGATLIRTAYFGKYVRGDDGRPLKDGFYEHIADADRYISHHHRQFDAVKEAMNRRNEKRRTTVSRNRYTGYL